MFEVEDRWQPEVHFVEGGTIWNSVKNFIYQEMQLRDKFLNIEVLNPVKDKAVRGTSLKKRHRAGATRWDTKASGYEGAKEEMLKFTGLAAARLDDQYDSCATLHMGFDRMAVSVQDDDLPQEEFEMRRQNPVKYTGRSPVTGY